MWIHCIPQQASFQFLKCIQELRGEFTLSAWFVLVPFWYFPPVFSFSCIKPLFLFFLFLLVKGDVAMLLRSDFYPHYIQENLEKSTLHYFS